MIEVQVCFFIEFFKVKKNRILPFEKISENCDNSRNNFINIETEEDNKFMVTSSKLMDSFTD